MTDDDNDIVPPNINNDATRRRGRFPTSSIRGSLTAAAARASSAGRKMKGPNVRGLRARSRERFGRSRSSSRESSRGSSEERSTHTEDDDNKGGRRGRGGIMGRRGRTTSRRRYQQQGQRKEALFQNYAKFFTIQQSRRSNNEAEDVMDVNGGSIGSAFDMENGGRNKHRSRSPGRHGRRPTISSSINIDTAQLEDPALVNHPFILPPQYALSPRTDVWFAFTITSCAAISSFGQLVSSSKSSVGRGTAGDKFALSVCALSFVWSLVGRVFTSAIGATASSNSMRGSRPSSGVCGDLWQRYNITPELVLLTLASFFWILAIPIISSTSTSGDELTLAMSGSEIWNANLFYASWVWTLGNRSGVVLRGANGSSGTSRSWTGNTITKRWVLLALNAIVVLSANVTTYNGPMCEGLLQKTDYCSRALVGLLVGGFLQILVTIAVGIMYRLGNMPSPSMVGNVITLAKRNKVTCGFAVVTLIVQSINTGLLTSPTGGGPATSSGTTYFASWIGFILGFELLLRYLELFTTIGADGSRGGGDLDASFNSRYARPRSAQRERPAQQELQQLAVVNKGGRSVGTASTATDEEDNGPVRMIIADNRDVQSEASVSQFSVPLFMEPNADFVSIGPHGALEPEETSKTSSGVNESIADTPVNYDTASSSGSGKNPDGFIYQKTTSKHFEDDEFEDLHVSTQDSAAFGARVYNQTSFQADKIEELEAPAARVTRMGVPTKTMDGSGVGVQHRRRPSLNTSSHSLSPLEEDTPQATRANDLQATVAKEVVPGRGERKMPRGGNTRRIAQAPTLLPRYRTCLNPPPSLPHGLLPLNVDRDSGSKKGSNKSGNSGPPPPPFPRSIHGNDGNHDDSTQFSEYNAPIASIETGGCGGSDSVVSDPTIDANFDPPQASYLPQKQRSMPMPDKEYQKNSSSSTSSYEYGKKWSDETEQTKYLRQSSDENPTSEELSPNNNKEVDEIVAAALAYAEKSHSEDGFSHHSSLRLKPTSVSSGKKYSATKQQQAAHNESIHSFYSDSQKGQPDGVRGGAESSPVDDLVAMALSQANRTASFHQSKAKRSSMHDSKSVNSMYSEGTDYSNQGSQHFDC
ncbi:predicted protein [Thalassiosira pseudonana CCMP1335]|uniref:Uncharacterized protein n=1 Tax=Thalassiosira pseudonana TaxID=35128 RepID=B8BRT1_THAPS|nr:predicted protein [Thalassiosira pseudonana CCMP1335]EED96010.1 predicted protein [Thalassiosira pseudonana CCMP1335]